MIVRITTLLIMVLLWTGVHAQQGYDSLMAPQVWLRADGQEVTPQRWADVSSYGRHATSQAGEGPVEGELLNYNPTALFDGENDKLVVPYSMDSLGALTVLSVYFPTDTTERAIWGLLGEAQREIWLSTHRVAGPDTTIDHYEKIVGLPILNTVVQHWDKPAMSEGPYLGLGTTPDQAILPYKGQLAELLVFDRALDYMQRIQLETYLAIKYGIGKEEGNYVSTSNQVLWNTLDNEIYGSRIAGIGRDDALGLYQKQGSSALDTTHLLAMSVGNLARTNRDNMATINPGDFIVWGDNNGLLDVETTEDQGVIRALVGRKWLVQRSGETASSLPVQLQLDLTQLPYSEGGYWLVADRGGSGNFAVDNLDYIAADSITSDSSAYFNNLSWDMDGSGKDAFGFMRMKELHGVVRVTENPDCRTVNSGAITIEVYGGSGRYNYTIKGDTDNYFKHWDDGSVSTVDHLPAGSFSLRVSDDNGGFTTRSFSLIAPGGLTLDLGEDQTLAEGAEIMLDATTQISDSIAVIYNWKGSHGFTSDQGVIKVSEPGVYLATVTNPADGCTATDDVTISGTAVQRFEVYPSIIAPNGSFNVSVSLEEAQTLTIRVTDTQGRIYEEVTGEDSIEYFFTSTLGQPGMYLVILQVGEITETRKIIVQ